MGFNCGIIGLPNVGKSTIFNALSGAGAQMAEYPFCTIEPNRHILPVPDERLKQLSTQLAKKDPIPTRIEFVDVAGLVQGASRGEGLGNKFLGHIRGVDALLHVVRCFDSADAVNVMGTVSPARDIDVINTELILADLDVLSRAEEKMQRQAKAGEKTAKEQLHFLELAIARLNAGELLKGLDLSPGMAELAEQYGLITLKPVLFLANIDEENAHQPAVSELSQIAQSLGSGFLTLSGRLEEEISELPQEEKQDYLQAMGLEQSGLDRLIHAAYDLLGLITFYTVTTDLQAWTVERGTSALAAAGKIHTDFQKGFIRAEVVHYDDLLAAGSEAAVRKAGQYRSEGRDYSVRDGDIIHFLFNV